MSEPEVENDVLKLFWGRTGPEEADEVIASGRQGDALMLLYVIHDLKFIYPFMPATTLR